MAWAEIGQIKLLVGQVSLERDGRMTLAEKGQLIEASDIIVTGSDGRVGITFTDNTRFSAGPGSRIELIKFAFDPATHEGEFLSKVNQGSLAVVSGDIAKHQPDAMKVQTPTSILGIRGTKFMIKVTP
ncbi:MAG: hypothetical protein HOK30_06575 [Rhodospirillaceae bacterium]|nr:hypothetical protein [Rhodospirillaceae bacterium]